MSAERKIQRAQEQTNGAAQPQELSLVARESLSFRLIEEIERLQAMLRQNNEIIRTMRGQEPQPPPESKEPASAERPPSTSDREEAMP